jgi:hypothetical protein
MGIPIWPSNKVTIADFTIYTWFLIDQSATVVAD